MGCKVCLRILGFSLSYVHMDSGFFFANLQMKWCRFISTMMVFNDIVCLAVSIPYNIYIYIYLNCDSVL